MNWADRSELSILDSAAFLALRSRRNFNSLFRRAVVTRRIVRHREANSRSCVPVLKKRNVASFLSNMLVPRLERGHGRDAPSLENFANSNENAEEVLFRVKSAVLLKSEVTLFAS